MKTFLIKNIGLTFFAIFLITSIGMAAPIIDILQPTDLTFYETDTNILNISGYLFDSNGIISVSWENNEGGSGSCQYSTFSNSWQKNGILLAEGSNLITVIAMDVSSNTTPDNILTFYNPGVTVDTNSPTIENISPADGYSTINSNMNITISASDNVGVDSVKINGADATSSGSNLWNYSTILNLGSNSMMVIAADTAGNQATQIVEYTRQNPPDITPPTIENISPADGYSTINSNMNITISASDNVGVDSVKINGADATSSDSNLWNYSAALNLGGNSMIIIAADIAGNQATQNVDYTRQNPPDVTPPTIDNISPPDGYSTINSNINITISASDNVGVDSVKINGADATSSGSNLWNYSAALNLGANSMTVIAADIAGNQATQNVNYTRQNPPDVTPPTIENISPADGYSTINSNVNITISASDNVGVDSVKINGADATSSGSNLWNYSAALNLGGNSMMVIAADIAGNQSTQIVDYTRQNPPDVTPPTIDNISPADGYSTINSNINITISASDNVGVDSVKINGADATFSGSNLWNYSAALNLGGNSMIIIAADVAGNQSTQNVDYTRQNPPDVTPPTIDNISPADGYSTINSNINITISASDNVGVDSVKINGADATSAGSNFWNYSAALNLGENSMMIIAADIAGNQSTQIVDYTRNEPPDVTPPTIDNISPADGYSTINSNINMTISASDNVGVDSVKINGADATSAGSNLWNYSASLNLGGNSMTVIAADVAGNQSTQIVDYTRQDPPDVTPPTIDNISPADGYSTTNSNVNITISASDNVGVSQVTINGIMADFDSISWTHTENLIENTNRIEVIAADIAGNQSTQIVNYIRQSIPEDLLEITTTSQKLTGYSGSIYIKPLNHNRDKDDTDLWTINGLPRNIGIGFSESGWIEGIPTRSGTFPISVKITDSLGQEAFTNLTITILNEITANILLSEVVTEAVEGEPYNTSLQIAGMENPNDWTFNVLSGMPNGVSLTADGFLDGVPTTFGEHEVFIEVYNSESNNIMRSSADDNIIKDSFTINIVDINDDKLSSFETMKTTIKVNWRAHTAENPNDKITAKYTFLPQVQDFSLTNGNWLVNIGNFPVVLNIIKSSKNGKAVKFSNLPENKTDLTIKGKAVLDKLGKVKTIIKIKNADVAEIYGLKSDKETQNLNYLPLKFNIGINSGHAILPMTGKTKIDKKTTLKLRK